jgi:hypothetical protein
MPPFADALGDEDIANIINYERARGATTTRR